jgi:4-hydroxy-tetrahydrodipicolinate reductase
MTKLIITGSKGRMGQTLLACAKADAALELVAGVDLGDDIGTLIDRCDVIIEFSAHDATPTFAKLAAQHRKAMVIGTTGHSDKEGAAIREATRTVPVVWAPNFSVGVNALFHLTQKTAELLGPDFDMEVVEMHHRMKADAPSGTARRLAEILAKARNKAYDQLARHGRVGNVGKRTPDEIGIHAVRGGDVVGDHTVIFAGIGERVELTHKASSRDTFALGALRAAKWVVGKPPALYDMQDVLGLR